MADVPPLGKLPRRPPSQYPRLIAEGMLGPRHYADAIEVAPERFVLGEYHGPPLGPYLFTGPWGRDEVNARMPRMVPLHDDFFDLGHSTWGIPREWVSERFSPLKALMAQHGFRVGPAEPQAEPVAAGALADQLEQLAELHAAGALSAVEFKKAKAKLLAGKPPGAL